MQYVGAVLSPALGAAQAKAIDSLRYEIERCFEAERFNASLAGRIDPFPTEKQARLAEWLWCAGYRHLTKEERQERGAHRMTKAKRL